MSEPNPIVYLVDDEPSVRKAVARLLRSAGHEAQGFGSPRDFLDEHDRQRPGCVVLDLAMPGFSGLRLQEELARIGSTLPVIFLSGHGDLPSGIKAMKDGAVDFLTKPVSGDALLAAIDRALEKNRTQRAADAAAARLQELLSRLTDREFEVMLHVVAGKLNKQIAIDLGTVEKTIKVHRGRVMEKLKVDSVADLVRLTEAAGISPLSPLQEFRATMPDRGVLDQGPMHA